MAPIPKANLPAAQAAALSDLFMQLSHSPKTRKMIARAVKEIDPDGHGKAFMDVDLDEKIEALQADQESRNIKAEGEKRQAKMEADRKALLAGELTGVSKYDEKQVAEIEKIMQLYGLTDYKAGAVLYANEHPPENPDPARVPTKHGATWEFPTLGQMPFAEFAKDPTKAARDGAYADIESFNRKRR